jgi:hypothetical protein
MGGWEGMDGWAGEAPARCQRGRLKLSSSGQSCSAAGGARSDRTAAPRRETASRGRRRVLLRAGSSGRRSPGCTDCAGSRRPGGRSDWLGSCQGSRQSSSSSRIHSSLSSTQRPRSPSRGRIPGPRLALREPGRAPDTPSTSWRPALTKRSMPCSRDQRSSMGQRYRRRPLSQRSRATPTTAMATPLHSRLQKKTATPVAHPR